MEQFFTTSDQIQRMIKGFNLTKTLFVSSIIIGESHTGKKTLARHLFPKAHMVSGNDREAVESALEMYDELIITNFEKLHHQEALQFDHKRIIATADFMGNSGIIDNLFAFIYQMPPLRARPGDTDYLKNVFLRQAKHDLQLDNRQFDLSNIPVALENNSKSLKRAVYQHLIIHTMGKKEIEEAMYAYLEEYLKGNNAYKEHLALYEKPLIRAGLHKYGSQLKLSQVLGINRNTLRKKIHEHTID